MNAIWQLAEVNILSCRFCMGFVANSNQELIFFVNKMIKDFCRMCVDEFSFYSPSLKDLGH